MCPRTLQVSATVAAWLLVMIAVPALAQNQAPSPNQDEPQARSEPLDREEPAEEPEPEPEPPIIRGLAPRAPVVTAPILTTRPPEVSDLQPGLPGGGPIQDLQATAPALREKPRPRQPGGGVFAHPGTPETGITTHRAGMSDNRNIIVHRAGRSATQNIRIHRAGMPVASIGRVHRAGMPRSANIRTHRAGRSDKADIRVHGLADRLRGMQR